LHNARLATVLLAEQPLLFPTSFPLVNIKEGAIGKEYERPRQPHATCLLKKKDPQKVVISLKTNKNNTVLLHVTTLPKSPSDQHYVAPRKQARRRPRAPGQAMEA